MKLTLFVKLFVAKLIIIFLFTCAHQINIFKKVPTLIHVNKKFMNEFLELKLLTLWWYIIVHIWIYSTCIAYVYLIFTLPIQWLSFHIYHHQKCLICSVTLKNCKNKGGLCRLQPFILIEKLRFNLKIVFFKIMPETLFNPLWILI